MFNLNGSSSNIAFDTNHKYTVQFYKDKTVVLKDDVAVGTLNVTNNNNPLKLGTGANRYCRIKNLEIKAL